MVAICKTNSLFVGILIRSFAHQWSVSGVIRITLPGDEVHGVVGQLLAFCHASR